ncbi:MAG: IS4 family transposase, partial [Pseudolabrys sp.]
LHDQILPDKSVSADGNSVSGYIIKIARLGVYLARASDGPPGNMVMWRGLARLSDIEFGALSGAKLVGN